jgi:dephospho-CoA kinase
MRVALTGGIAAGKSTVSRRLADLGAEIIDYDQLSREVVQPGSAALQRVVAQFGPQALDQRGGLDRTWMANEVFAQGGDGARRRLESIIHPLVFDEAAKLDNHALHALQGQDKPRLVIHEIPLLAEVWEEIPFAFKHVISVEAPVDQRVGRMLGTRHMSQHEAENRVKSQSTRYERQQIADIIIDSSPGFEQMFDAVDRVYECLIAEDGRQVPMTAS